MGSGCSVAEGRGGGAATDEEALAQEAAIKARISKITVGEVMDNMSAPVSPGTPASHGALVPGPGGESASKERSDKEEEDAVGALSGAEVLARRSLRQSSMGISARRLQSGSPGKRVLVHDVPVARLKPYEWEETLVTEVLDKLKVIGGHEAVSINSVDVRRWATVFAARHLSEDGGATEDNIARVTRRSAAVNKALASMGLRYFRVVVSEGKPSSMNGTMLKALVTKQAEAAGPDVLVRNAKDARKAGFVVGGLSAAAYEKALSESSDGGTVSSDDDEEDDEDYDGVEAVDDLDMAF